MLLRKLFFPLLILIFSLNSFASSVQDEEVIQGNQYYKNGNFEKAIASYEKVLTEGYESSSLYYNLGNAYYRTGKLGYAILNYERALKLAPNDEDIIHNLAFVNTKIPDRIESVPTVFFVRWWDSLLAFFTVNGWTYVVYILYLALLVIIAGYILYRNPKIQRLLFFSGSGILILLIISIVILSIDYSKELNLKNGVITETSVAVKNAPDEKSNDAFVIHEGLKVRLDDKVDNWYKIKLKDGKVGWILKDALTII